MDKERGPEHYNAILLEEVRSQMELVLEKVTGSEDRLMTAIRELRIEHDQRFDVIEAVLRQHSQILQQHDRQFEKIGQRLDRVETQIVEMRQELSSTRQELSAKIDTTGVRLDHHEQDISLLKQAAGSN